MKAITDNLEKALERISSVETVKEGYQVIVHEAKHLFGAKDGAIILPQKEGLEKVYESSPVSLEQAHHEKIHQIATILFEKSHVFIPLQRGEKLLGVLVLQLAKDTSFEEQDKISLQIYGTVAALVIENKQLHETHIQDLKEFMSYASHEIRNPLTSLHGYIQLLYSKREKDTKEGQWIEELYKESVKFIALVKDMFDPKKIKQK